MATISCRIFVNTIELLPSRDLTVERWCEGLPVAPEKVCDPTDSVDWDVGIDLIVRLRELLGSDRAFREFSLDTLKHARSGPINRLFRVAANPEQLYRVLLWAQRFFGTPVDTTFEVLDDGRFQIGFRVAHEYSCPEFLRFSNQCVLEALPVALGLEPAIVETVPSMDPHEQLFYVQPPEAFGLGTRFGRAWAALRGKQDDLAILAEQQQQLLEQYRLTETANRENLEHVARLRVEASRRVEAEARLRQAQKLEVIGQLAGGVAHDFNNLLTAILGNLGILELDLPPDSELARCAEDAMGAARSGAALTQSLLAFSRKQPLTPRVVDINTVVAKSVEMIRRTVPENIELAVAPSREPALCRVDVTQLQNAILNLAVNAQQALPDGGRIGLEVREGLPDEHGAKLVILTVSDDGCGMSQEVLGRVFEPFFTTRKAGAGSGMGLSMVYGFVHQSGGDVAINSRVGEGTRVVISLPRSAGAPDDPAAVVVNRPRGGGELILVVEDHPQVRLATDSMLTRLGYKTRLAENATKALELLDEEVGLMLADIVMPGVMSGTELAKRAQERFPGLPVILTTGYAPEQIGEVNVPLLLKPYTTEDLARVVREELDRPQPRRG